MLEAAHAALADAGLVGFATSTAWSRRRASRPPSRSRRTSASRTSATRSRCTWAARARSPALQSAALAVASGIATARARGRGLERLLGASAPSPARAGRGSASRRRPRPSRSSTSTCRYGAMLPVQLYAWICMRHKQVYGSPTRRRAAVALACRRHAQLNPKALLRGKPLTMERLPRRRAGSPSPSASTTARSRPTARPRSWSLPSERARDLARRPVAILGAAEGHPYPADDIPSRPDLFRVGLSFAAPAAFAQAGRPAPRRRLARHLRLLHATSRCCSSRRSGCADPASARDFVADGNIELGGRYPMNTHGGLLVAGPHVGHEPRGRDGAPAARRGGRGAGAGARARARHGLGRLRRRQPRHPGRARERARPPAEAAAVARRPQRRVLPAARRHPRARVPVLRGVRPTAPSAALPLRDLRLGRHELRAVARPRPRLQLDGDPPGAASRVRARDRRTQSS